MCDTTYFGQTFSTAMTCALFPAQVIETLDFLKNMSLVSETLKKKQELQRFPLWSKRNDAISYFSGTTGKNE